MTTELQNIPVRKFQFLKPKDGKDYTWRRIRQGEWERVSGGMPETIFPPEATVTVENHEAKLRTTGSQVAHMAEKYED